MAVATSTPTGLPDSLTTLKGVGPALAKRLENLNVHTPLDLLFLLPLRYEDRTRLSLLGGLAHGQRVVVEGEIALTQVVFRRRRTLLCRISDGTGMVTLRFFYFSRKQQESLCRGQKIRCFGTVRAGPDGMEIVHPEYRLVTTPDSPPLEQRLTPVYPSTEGLQQSRLRALIRQALDSYLTIIPDLLPGELVDELAAPELHAALRFVHEPPADADLASLATGFHPCQRRLAAEEMLAQHLSLRRTRDRARTEQAFVIPVAKKLRADFLQQLAFSFTSDQEAALKTIEQDLAQEHPMMRLLQGDVGCGKTVVAAAAVLGAVAGGYQVAIMAPTELLAEQQRNSFGKWFKPLGINIAWLSGSLKKSARDLAYAAIANGEAQVIIGTHALFQQELEYHRLAFVIVDEQHRFGVSQRLSLWEKGSTEKNRDRIQPHQLVMTATPIPRTLAMIMYADLDVSVIRELPPGRQPVQTVALSDQRRGDVVDRVRQACAEKRRAYWVCPLIEESDLLEARSAEATFEMLRSALPDVKVGLIHGRMKPDEKDKIMKAFATGRSQVLVATTVIEVGVDVPEASLMIIENSERLGLSQLHQLRGRVGRGDEKSTCVLLYRSPLSKLAKQRLAVLRDTGDGFRVAREDLKLRGPGEVLGTRQTGLMQLRVADLVRDADLAPMIQNAAGKLIDQHPENVPLLIARWLGHNSRYGSV